MDLTLQNESAFLQVTTSRSNDPHLLTCLFSKYAVAHFNELSQLASAYNQLDKALNPDRIDLLIIVDSDRAIFPATGPQIEGLIPWRCRSICKLSRAVVTCEDAPLHCYVAQSDSSSRTNGLAPEFFVLKMLAEGIGAKLLCTLIMGVTHWPHRTHGLRSNLDWPSWPFHTTKQSCRALCAFVSSLGDQIWCPLGSSVPPLPAVRPRPLLHHEFSGFVIEVIFSTWATLPWRFTTPQSHQRLSTMAFCHISKCRASNLLLSRLDP